MLFIKKKSIQLFLFIIILSSYKSSPIPKLISHSNTWQTLTELGFKNPLKLHLGCGTSHINGYINIDFPPSEHTVQNTSGADIFGNISQLLFPAQTIDEFRSHHVFEHFNRQHALALLCSWHHALKIGGIITIETPDFEESIKLLMNPNFSYLQKQMIMRHIFGSHEAFWAIHYDGWYENKYRHVFDILELKLISCQKASYLVTRNITIQARKEKHISEADLRKKAKQLLRENMINTTPDEEQMWQVWCDEFDANFKIIS